MNLLNDVRVCVVLGAWSTGSTAITGYINRLGAYGCPPHQMTVDERTPNSYEAQAFRDKLAEMIDELTLLAKIENRKFFKDWFAEWIQQEKIKAQKQGYQLIVLKHPLAAFFIPEIQTICQPQWVVITRSFSDIEKTRLRRRWHPIYGEAGASLIYSKIFSQLLIHGLSSLNISFEEFRSRRDRREHLAQWLNITPSDRQVQIAEAWVKK